ncbi:uncharacterized protein PAC_14740 [Phialocephala subalpina]|uniref:Uncharacterized protein n=1 Tax=Phialocephala subalpina TaxID=576137 RepID=A0A1L7XII8_9HELO|nr:uncharacterized protein PAC_14740 [Phialocephala subalpina]
MNNNTGDMNTGGRRYGQFHDKSESEADMLSSQRRSTRSRGKRTASSDGSQTSKKVKTNSLAPNTFSAAQGNVVSTAEASTSVGDNPSSPEDSNETNLPTRPRYRGASSPATYKHALVEYRSVLDVDPPKIIHQLENEGINLEALFRKNEFAGGTGMKVGDKLKVIMTDTITKEVEITGRYQRRPFPAVQPQVQRAGRVADQSFQISVPPGEHTTASTRFPNVQFPNANRPESVRGPNPIWEAALSVLPPHIQHLARQGPQKGEQWDTVLAFRDGEELGCLNDIRLALQFCMNEHDLSTQLTFTGGRTRKVAEGASTAAKAGFYLSKNNGLYLKVRTEKVVELNQDLLIDLGSRLNDLLAAEADTGYAIIMVDLRILITDGLPVPSNSTFEDVLAKGPKAFPTAFTETLAGSCGWTNGHAHMGLKSLAKKSPDQDEPAVLDLGIFKHIYTPTRQAAPAVPEEEVTLWTADEKSKVDAFHSKKIEGKILHYPIPLTQSRRPSNIIVTQYCKSRNDWIVDKTVHGDDVGRVTVFDASFGQARLRERTRELPARVRPRLHDESPMLAGRRYGRTITGYEDAGRGSPPPDRGERIQYQNLHLIEDLPRFPRQNPNEDAEH